MLRNSPNIMPIFSLQLRSPTFKKKKHSRRKNREKRNIFFFTIKLKILDNPCDDEIILKYVYCIITCVMFSFFLELYYYKIFIPIRYIKQFLIYMYCLKMNALSTMLDGPRSLKLK